MIRPAAFAACLLVAGCTGRWQPFVPDNSRLPPGALGGYSVLDPDVAAVQQAQWAFADPGRTKDRPIEAARAAAAMDYVAGQLNVSPRWANISALTKQMLLQGRVEVRDALGVAPGATSQEIVDHLADAGNALAAGHDREAERALGAPVFLQAGTATLQRLSNLPYMQAANVSTMRAAGELFGSNGGSRRF